MIASITIIDNTTHWGIPWKQY